MKTIIATILTAVAAITFVGCGGTANSPAVNNTNAANANANNAKPTAAAPTKEALVAMETKAFEAWKTKDTKFWDGFLADNYVGVGEKGRVDKAQSIKDITNEACDVKSYALADEKMTPAGSDAAILTYKATADATCGGKKIPADVWAATVYVRSGDTWKAAYHNEIPITDPKAAPAKPEAKPAVETKPAADAKPADAATEALLSVEKKGWEAWKARDAKAIEGMLAKDLTMIDRSGRYEYDGTMKSWFESKCDVKSYSLTDPAGSSLTKDISILTFNGGATGTCDGQPLGNTRSTSVYIKEGQDWKLLLSFSTPA